MATMRILDATGDTALEFDVDDAVETARVRAVFDELVRVEKRLAFAHSGDGTDPVLIRTFDPHAEEIIVTRPLAEG